MNISKSTNNIPLLFSKSTKKILAVGSQEPFLDLMKILSKARFFRPLSWNSNNLLVTKIIEEVKKLVDKIKNLYKCNFNRTNRRKANKIIENFKKKSFCFIALFLVRVAGQRIPSPPSFCLGEVPSNSTQNPQCNIDSSTVVFWSSNCFFPICFGK